MALIRNVLVMMVLMLLVAAAAKAQEATTNQTSMTEHATSTPQSFLESLVGSWEGICKTWFRPGELADESPVTGEFRLIFGGRFLRHTYEGELQGKLRAGEETIAKVGIAVAQLDELGVRHERLELLRALPEPGCSDDRSRDSAT